MQSKNPHKGYLSLDIAVSTDNHRRLLRTWSAHLLWWHTKAIPVPEEKNTFTFPGSCRARLNPLAPPSARVETFEEANCTTLGITAVVLAHDWLDGLGSLISIIEWDG